jgi:hypothetical protein
LGVIQVAATRQKEDIQSSSFQDSRILQIYPRHYGGVQFNNITPLVLMKDPVFVRKVSAEQCSNSLGVDFQATRIPQLYAVSCAVLMG